MSNIIDWDLFMIVWFPHSGCRWLNRSLLARHPGIAMGEYYSPWLTYSTDAILSLDRTSQVHNSRSRAERAEEFRIVKKSVDYGREQGTRIYFEEKKRLMDELFSGRKHGGVLPLGSPEPQFPDLDLLFRVNPSMRIVHLVRHPVDCFLSLKSRHEMDGDVHRIGSRWVGINAALRVFGSTLEDPAKYIVLRYEDLVENTSEQMRRLCEWIGVPYERSIEQGLSEYHGRNQDIDLRDLTTEKEKSILMSVTHSEAKYYGYGSG